MLIHYYRSKGFKSREFPLGRRLVPNKKIEDLARLADNAVYLNKSFDQVYRFLRDRVFSGSSFRLAVSRVTILSAACAAVLAFSTLVYAVPADLSYFIGDWTVTVKDGSTFTWTVKSEMNGEWLTGIVARDNVTSTTDHWRMVGKNVERFVFTSDGIYIRMSAPGWRAGKMSFTGTASGKAGDFRVRETITRESENRFRALWEKQDPDGKWSLMSEEVCSK
jgi:hypothetical protein